MRCVGRKLGVLRYSFRCQRCTRPRARRRSHKLAARPTQNHLSNASVRPGQTRRSSTVAVTTRPSTWDESSHGSGCQRASPCATRWRLVRCTRRCTTNAESRPAKTIRLPNGSLTGRGTIVMSQLGGNVGRMLTPRKGQRKRPCCARLSRRSGSQAVKTGRRSSLGVEEPVASDIGYSWRRSWRAGCVSMLLG